MVAPPFGFSPSDVVEAINFIRKATKALREISGAAQQYQQASLELQAVEKVLKRAQALTPFIENVDTVERIQFYAHACHVPLAGFCNRIQKFAPHLGSSGDTTHQPTSSKVKVGVHAVEWALQLEKELDKLKSSILPALVAINLELQFETIDRNCDTYRSVKQNLQVSQELLPRVNGLKDVLLTEVARQDQMSVLNQLTGRILTQQQDHLPPILAAVNSTQGSVAGMKHRIEDIESLLSGIKKSLEQGPDISPPMASLASSTTLSSVANATEMQHPSVPHLPHHDSCETSAGPQVDRRGQFEQFLKGIRKSLAEIFVALFALGFGQVLQRMIPLIRAPSLLLDSNIKLEDALGRTLSLQYEHFRYWPVVQARLESAFLGLPGEALVRRNEFHIELMGISAGRIISGEAWANSISPGAKVAMSMLYRRPETMSRACPRCESIPSAVADAWACTGAQRAIYCAKCHISYRIMGVRPQRRRSEDSSSSEQRPDSSTKKSEWNASVVRNGAAEAVEDEEVETIPRNESAFKPTSSVNPVALEFKNFRRIHIPRANNQGNLKDIIHDCRLTPRLPWARREKWAEQIVRGVADMHKRGHAHLHLKLSNIVIDDQDDVLIVDMSFEEGVPPGWESPEMRRIGTHNRWLDETDGAGTNIYQLGMILWAIGCEVPEPEQVEQPFPDWFHDASLSFQEMVTICLRDQPHHRFSANELLERFFAHSIVSREREEFIVADSGFMDDNSLLMLSNEAMDQLELFQGDLVLVTASNGKKAAFVVVPPLELMTYGIRQAAAMNAVARVSLGAEFGDAVSIEPYPDMPYARTITVMTMSEEDKNLSGAILEDSLKQYFRDALRPLVEGNIFTALSIEREVWFRVVALDPRGYGVITNDTVIICEGI